MQRLSRPEGLELPPPQMQHSPNSSGDRNAMSSPSLASPPSVAPDPVYIAASTASQIITSDHQSQIDDWFDDRGGRVDAETAVVSSASLSLINAFLDQLLFNILACARSTSILSLRPAVAEVLKPRLAKDAINGADEELHEFLGGGDEEELSSFHNGHESRGKWDLNLVWRRTRLRCMVYTRLGDMEEEDEEMYIERERMEDANEDHRRLSRELGIISPAAAIFLTSILEFIGEHALMVAGEAAFNRRGIQQLRIDHDSAANDDESELVVVEDIDIEKLAFNTTLGRLWRSWKKRVRTPSVSYSRPLSRDFVRKRVASSSASPSVSEVDEANQSNLSIHDVPRSSVAEVLQEEQEPHAAAASSVDSHVSSRGLVVGLAETTSGETSVVQGRGDNRPRSMMAYPHPFVFLPLTNFPGSNSPNEATHVYPGLAPARSRWHQRSASLPSPGLSPYVSPHDTFFTPLESPESILAAQDDRSDTAEDGSLSEEDMSAIAGDHTGSEVSTARYGSESKLNQEAPVNEMSSFKSRETSFDEPSGDRGSPDASGEERRTAPESPPSASHPIRYDEARESSCETTRTTERAAVDFKIAQTIDHDAASTGKDDGAGHHSPDGRVSKTLAERETQDDVVPTSLATMQGQRVRADDELRSQKEILRLGKRSAPFVYGITSIPRSDPDAGDSIRLGQDLSSGDIHLTPAKVNSHASSSEHGAPPLTPLRELMEAAHDTSDDSSSLAPSHDASKSDPIVLTEASQTHGSSSPGSRASSSFSPTKRSSRGNQTVDSRKDLTSVNAAGADRAAVQRISPPSPREPLGALARTSTSSNRPYTSASGTSQLSHKIKTLIGRESTEGHRQPELRRTSSVDSVTTSDTQSEKTPEAVDKQRSFEELINSDQTIQYTLTPKNMRDMEMTDSSRAKSSQPGTREPGDLYLNGESAGLESDRSTTGRTAVTLKGLNGLRSIPLVGAKRPDPSPSPPPSSQTEKGQLQTSSTSSIGRSNPIIPRDARPKMETTTDFVNFIRTTGPEAEPESSPNDAHLFPGVVTRPEKPITTASRISSTPKRSSSQKVNQSSPSVSSTVKRQKLQARDPTVSYGDQSSDLIDFIRQGPAHDRGDGSHRIPRTVAPFRTTMDSDEIQALGNGKGKEALDARSSIASTQDSLAPVKSTHSPSNSRTALIDNTNRSKTRNVSAPVALNPPRLDEPPHPVRKQRRFKDPYVIDADTDEDDEPPTVPKPQHQEDNLIDFLRSVTPPPARPTIPSAFDGIQKPTRNTLQKKSSGPSMRDRFAQNSPPSSSSKTLMTKPVQRPGSGSSSVRRKNEAPQIPPLSARATSPHLITQVGTKFDSYKPTHPTYAAHIDRERNGARRAYQARPEREPDSGMSELADFFRNSGPPSPPAAQPPPAKTPAVGRVAKEESGFSKIFSRKKKAAARA
ncbi:hypothetical protein MMC07_005123 [Pseudocyphellaria aurata]|nr:hypothetical protein [Pseudocyphellaria aurata]